MCVAGTRWVQTELLQKYPHANLRVYAVWFNMMPNDSRAKWSPTLLSDSRVRHWWDEPKTTGTWYGRRDERIRPLLTPDSNWTAGDVLWDAYLLYDSTARWDAEPTGLIHFGRTIVAGRDTLKTDFGRLFALED